MKSLALGLMSGTSGDGVSAALAQFSDGEFKVLGYSAYPYKSELSSKIRNPSKLTLAEISALNFEIGEVFASAALRLLRKLRISPQRVAVIGSHGQTIFHAPQGQPSSTLQVGESSVIAERTGIAVVSDFRTRDIAAGGQGAPLIPFFDHRFFGDGPARSLLNIGGIANTTVVGRSVQNPIAFDTGPGNCLMDWAAFHVSRGAKLFDSNGSLAAKGTIDLNAVSQMAEHPYFLKNPPKSTGREIFNGNFIPKKLLKAKPETLLATLTYFTAFAIFEAHERLIFPAISVQELIVSGGGVFNRTLMDHLRALFSPVKVRSISEFGRSPITSWDATLPTEVISFTARGSVGESGRPHRNSVGLHPQAKEPLAFAFFAWQALAGKSNHLPQGTGARGERILGKITPGARFKGIR